MDFIWFYILTFTFILIIRGVLPKRNRGLILTTFIIASLFILFFAQIMLPIMMGEEISSISEAFGIVPSESVTAPVPAQESRCIVYGDVGSKTYLDSMYGDNTFCDIVPDGMSYRAVCCEGICEVGECP